MTSVKYAISDFLRKVNEKLNVQKVNEFTDIFVTYLRIAKSVPYCYQMVNFNKSWT